MHRFTRPFCSESFIDTVLDATDRRQLLTVSYLERIDCRIDLQEGGWQLFSNDLRYLLGRLHAVRVVRTPHSIATLIAPACHPHVFDLI